MNRKMRCGLFACAAASLLLTAACAVPEKTPEQAANQAVQPWKEGEQPFAIQHVYPCNVYPANKPVVLTLQFRSAGMYDMEWVLRDGLNAIIDRGKVNVAIKDPVKALPFKFLPLPVGYFELEVTGKAVIGDKTADINLKYDFIHAPMTNRLRNQALKSGARFGVQGGFGTAEIASAFAKLGMPWRRDLLFWGPLAGGDEKNPDWSVLKAHAKNINPQTVHLYEVKSLPWWCSGKPRPGSIESHPCMVYPSNEEKFVKYIEDQISFVPGDDGWYEVWNEPPDFTPEEFAGICQMVRKGVKKTKPNGKVGPNINNTLHLTELIQAGGLKDMDMITIHPYSSDFTSSPEFSGLAERIEAFREVMREKLGYELPLYVTEIGWPTPSGGPMRNTEYQQACYMSRASLIMYAADIKAVMPYCMGQPETDPNEKEHFFGFARKNQEPKPVLAAYAATAGMLEGSEYLGELWLGKNVGAMLFRLCNGELALAVYSDNAKIPVFFRTYKNSVEHINMFGARSRIATPNGRCSVTTSDDVQWFVGLGEKILNDIDRTKRERWNKFQRPEFDVVKLSGDPKDEASWANIQSRHFSTKDIPEEHFHVDWQAARTDDALWLNVKVHDVDPGDNSLAGANIWAGDCIEIFCSGAPHRSISGFVSFPNDKQLLVSPFSVNGPCACFTGGAPAEGLEAFWKTGAKDGWSGIIKLPFKLLDIDPTGKYPFSLDIAVDDSGFKEHGRRQTFSNGRMDTWANAGVWSLMKFK